ncbi:hypothetical protein [Mycoplasma sp. P36-A1]|uniref:hypothetical protein n=1 Tax=Mycoplasma sp. P36-A1 TaxID=3252900 RepID=UPI003C2EE97B
MKKKILFLTLLVPTLLLLFLFIRQFINNDMLTAKTTLLGDLKETKYIKEKKNNVKNYSEYYINNSNFEVVKNENACKYKGQLKGLDVDSSNYYYIYEESVIIYYLENDKCQKIAELPNVDAISINIRNFEDKVIINIMSREPNKSGIYLVNKNGAILISKCEYFAKFIVNDVDKTIITLEPNEDDMYIREYNYDGKKIKERVQNYNSDYYDDIFVLDSNTIGLIEFKYENLEVEESDMVIEFYEKNNFFSKMENKDFIKTKIYENFEIRVTNIQVIDGLISFDGSGINGNEFTTLICTIDFEECNNYEFAILLKDKYIFISENENMSINISRFGEKTYEKILNFSEAFLINNSDNDGFNLTVYNDKRDNFEIRYDYLEN